MEKYTLPEDTEKEQLKSKIKSITDFPLFRIKGLKSTDPRYLLEVQSRGMKPGDIDQESYAQLILVILGEQLAYDAQYCFESKEKEKEFIDLVESTGVYVEVESEEIIDGKIQVNFIFATSEENKERMKKIRETESDNFALEYGRLMGFPESAIHDFIQNKSEGKKPLSQKEIGDERFDTKGLLGAFKLSREHVDEERALLLKRNELLREYAPQLFR